MPERTRDHTGAVRLGLSTIYQQKNIPKAYLDKIHTSIKTMQQTKSTRGYKEASFGPRKMVAQFPEKLDTSKAPRERVGTSLENVKVSEETGKQQVIKYPGKQ